MTSTKPAKVSNKVRISIELHSGHIKFATPFCKFRFEARKRRNGTKCGGKKNQTEKKLASEKAPAEKKSKAGKKLTQESGATVGGKRKKQ